MTDTQTTTTESLRDQLRAYATGKSNTQVARKIGYSPAVISLYLAEGGNKYSGDIEKLEKRIADFLRNEARRRASGVETTDCEVASEIRSGLEYIRRTNDVGMIMAESGEGKTRGLELYCEENPLSILYRTKQWSRDLGSIEANLLDAIGRSGYDHNTKRAVWMVEKLRGSDRLIIVDDAHKLTRPALQFLFDFNDETGCPLALVGTFDLDRLVEDDPQRFSRAGLRWEVRPKNGRRLIQHLIRTLAPGANGEADHLLALCELVAAEHGHFRSVHKQLKLAAEIKENKPKEGWVSCFKAAHTMLVRKYPLKD